MLKYFSVSNFKNFKEKVEFDFSDIRDYRFNECCVKNGLLHNIIIYGQNASGKTNLGYALFDITYHLVDKSKNFTFYQNYTNADSDEKYAEFCYVFDFEGAKLRYEYKKASVNELVYEKLSLDGLLLFKYDFQTSVGNFEGIRDRVSDTLRFDNKFDISLVKYIVNNTVIPEDSPIKKMIEFVSNMLWFRSIGNDVNLGYQISENNVVEYIINKDLVGDFENFLNECGINEKLICKESPDGKRALYFKKKRLIPFIQGASSGTIALSMFFFWFHEADILSFLWIDEFDAFYHYELAEKIVSILEKEVKCQVVLTSHNTNLLSNRIMRPDCYFILSNGKLKSVVNSTERELREGHNLEKLYKSGEFND